MVNVHFGMAGHVVTMLAVAYTFLQWTLDVCEQQEQWDRDDSCQDDTKRNHPIIPTTTAFLSKELVQIELPSKEWVKEHKPQTILPQVMEQSWTKRKKSISKNTLTDACPSSASISNSNDHSPCIFAFLAAPLGTHQSKERLNEFLKPFLVVNTGWFPQNNFRHGGFQNKLGVVATTPTAKAVLQFPQIQKPVQFITIHYLKSYGTLWEDSRAKFTMEIISSPQRQLLHTQSWELEGVHPQPVSISYFTKWQLGLPAPVGSSIRFHMELIGGQTFKINALMLCSR
jgi:hypothetical protein